MFTLIPLPYAPDALAPAISAQTLSFHHGKHLQGYVDNLNKLIAGTEFESMSLEDIVVKTSVRPPVGPLTAIFNNAGQILNHNLYFTQFRASNSESGNGHSGLAPESPSSCPAPTSSSCPAPTSSSCPAPTGHLKAQIEKQWGTLDAFKADFVAKGVSLFGSGWVWLSAAPDGSLVITQEPGANNPICRTVPVPEPVVGPVGRPVPEPVEGPAVARLKPLLTFDVWEHAYYLDYQNRRAAHLEALWGIVDWRVIEARYMAK